MADVLKPPYREALEQIIKFHATEDGDVAKLMCREAAYALTGEAECNHD